MFGLGITEIMVILGLALIVIGPKKLPELAKTLGKGFKEFQNAARGLSNDLKSGMDEEEEKENHHASSKAPSSGKSIYKNEQLEVFDHDDEPEEHHREEPAKSKKIKSSSKD